MDREFKPPQIFADVLTLVQVYYPLHNNLPKPFHFAVSERFLPDLAKCPHLIVLANAVDTNCGAASRWVRLFEAR